MSKTITRKGIGLKANIGKTVVPGNPPIKLPLSALTLDPEIQQRAQMSADLIGEYAESVATWIDLAPITVITDGQTRWVADGFHRVEAAKAARLDAIPAHQRQGSRRDALLFAVGANRAHGLRRTNADKRRAVETLLNDPEWSQWSDRMIADKAGVSPSTVGAIRAQLSNLDSSTEEPTKRLGADGKERTVPAPDPEKEAKREAEGWRQQWKEMCDAKRAVEAALKEEQDKLRDAEEVHHEHLTEMRQRIAEEERNRPRTDAELAEHHAKLQALQDEAARAQAALNQATKERTRLDTEIQEQHQARALAERVLSDWASAAIQYRQVALKLAGAGELLKQIPISAELYQQIATIRELTEHVARALDVAHVVREVSA